MNAHITDQTLQLRRGGVFGNPVLGMHFVASLDSTPEMRPYSASSKALRRRRRRLRACRQARRGPAALGPARERLANLHNARRHPRDREHRGPCDYHLQYDAPSPRHRRFARPVSSWICESKRPAPWRRRGASVQAACSARGVAR